MKRGLLKKLLISGTTALGIVGFAAPAAFAWSGGGGGYSTSRYNNVTTRDNYGNTHSCYMHSNYGYGDWDSNRYGGYDRNCYTTMHRFNYASYKYDKSYCDRGQNQYW